MRLLARRRLRQLVELRVALERQQLVRAPHAGDAAPQLVDGVRVELLRRPREQLRHQDLARRRIVDDADADVRRLAVQDVGAMARASS